MREFGNFNQIKNTDGEQLDLKFEDESKVVISSPSPEPINVSKSIDSIEDEEQINERYDLHDSDFRDRLDELLVDDPAAYNEIMEKISRQLEDDHNKNIPDGWIEEINTKKEQTPINISGRNIEENDIDNERPDDDIHGRYAKFKFSKKNNLYSQANKKVKTPEEKKIAKEKAIKEATKKRDVKERSIMKDPWDFTR